MDVKLSKRKNILVGSYIELNEFIKNKKCCVNIKNNDDKCFFHVLIAYKNYDKIKSKDKNETRHYKSYLDTVKEPENVSYPVVEQDINKWEIINDLKINVFELDDENKLYCVYNDSFYKNKNVVNMLLIYNEDKSKSHYVWLKNLDRFSSSDTSKHSIFRCQQCLEKRFATKELLEKHTKNCMENKVISEKFPTD